MKYWRQKLKRSVTAMTGGGNQCRGSQLWTEKETMPGSGGSGRTKDENLPSVRKMVLGSITGQVTLSLSVPQHKRGIIRVFMWWGVSELSTWTFTKHAEQCLLLSKTQMLTRGGVESKGSAERLTEWEMLGRDPGHRRRDQPPPPGQWGQGVGPEK